MSGVYEAVEAMGRCEMEASGNLTSTAWNLTWIFFQLFFMPGKTSEVP